MASEGVFQQQIKCMMYAFGDAKNPNSDCALLVEEFTRQQMRDIVSHAVGVSNMRNGRMVQTKDIMFLLRKDKDKLKRLIRYTELKAMTKKVNKTQGTLDDIEGPNYGGTHKRVKLSLDFLTPLEIAGLKLEEIDELEVHRLAQQDATTRNMNAKQYMEYTECRTINLHKNMSKFKEWINIDEITSLKLSPDVLDVIGHLAHETVRKLVELSLQVKRDMESKTHSSRQCPATHSHFGPVPILSVPPITDSVSHRSDKGGPAGGSFVLSTPPSSPPTNILSSPLTSTDNEYQVAITTSSIRRSSRETRKRQQGSQAPSMQEQEPVSEPAPVPSTLTKPTPHALKPVHIHEALRRLSQTNLTAPVTPLWTHHPTSRGQRSWCL